MRIGKHELALPILQGGMGVGVSMGGLAGAVAACGGMGTVSTADAGYLEPDFDKNPFEANLRALKREIGKAKEIAKGAGMVGVVKTIRQSLRATHEIFVCEMGAKYVGKKLANEMLKTFLETEFEGGRHARRVGKMEA